MSTKELKVSFNAPLNELDTEVQTYGCRANNPDICAFTSEDGICRKPSRAWKKQYHKLSGGQKNE